ncbi:hypothetical protein SH611_17485 [Geminicoccaceae bacterium 1502E]|nr:hypothetical protein [Geminicoccaceae bacterium 1502E]
MTSYAAYLERVHLRLEDLGSTLHDLENAASASEDGGTRRRLVDLRAALEVAREQYKGLRREGSELSEEQTQSFNARLERLGAGIGELRRQIH